MSHKSTPYDAFDEIHQVVLDGISDNTALLFEPGKYGAISTTDTIAHEFYVIMFTSEAYTLQDNTKIDGKIITAGELVVKSKYICSMQIDNNWYWDQHPKHHFITVPTCKILHPQLEVNAITYFHDVLKSVCNRKQAKQIISRHPICLTDSDYDCILEEIGCGEKKLKRCGSL